MKKLTLLFALLTCFSFTAMQAQKSCCKKSASAKAACASKTADQAQAAAKLASLDETIESRVCDKTGSVSYVQKSVCAYSGSVSYADVEYDSEQESFVKVVSMTDEVKSAKKECTPAEKAACKKTCTEAEKAACGVKSAKAASKVSLTKTTQKTKT